MPTIRKATRCSDPTDSGVVDTLFTGVDTVGCLPSNHCSIFFLADRVMICFYSVSVICMSGETGSPTRCEDGR